MNAAFIIAIVALWIGAMIGFFTGAIVCAGKRADKWEGRQ